MNKMKAKDVSVGTFKTIYVTGRVLEDGLLGKYLFPTITKS